MKKTILWSLAVIITIAAALYQRTTGPTYPKVLNVTLNGTPNKFKLTRSIALNERSEVKLNVEDENISAKLYYKRFKSDEEYQVNDFKPRKEKRFVGLFAEVPQQPAAGKIQYYLEVTDDNGSQTFFKEAPIVIRFKGGVPALILVPHILLMFVAMLFSTLAGLMSLIKYPQYKKYAIWTLLLFIAGGMILGPVVQYYAFGELWTGIPLGWDLTDNKTLIALIFWILAVVMNRKSDKPMYTALAALVLLLVYSIPHSLFGSELDYASGEVTQGIILSFF